MRRRRAAAAGALALLVFSSSPALAWDPDRERSEAPTTEQYPDPAPFIAPPPDLYYVTDTYVADVVVSSGPLTTYFTTTVHESTGSYARVLDTVGTGVSSAFDGSAFNGRRALGDGRLVAGTYYENYVLTAGGFVPVSIVFFQDDAELARLLAVEPPGPTTTEPTPGAQLSIAPALGATCCTAGRTAAIAPPTPGAVKPIRPGISLLPASAPLSSLEVLRGRAVSLWPRAFVDGREVPVRSWTVIAGEPGDELASRGPGTVPFRSSWPRLAPPGSAYEVVFRIEVDSPDAGHRTVDAAIAVVVRSPALEE
ncbi:MAG: hypothetical protein M3T56_09750 [Chloroflexota bacterium]|nr:hypothetical protein [Chloroflexota bacterium]